MKILFVHQNFPGQYLHLAPALGADPENRVVALGTRKDVSLPGVQTLAYDITRKPSENIHPWLAEQEVKIIRGEAVARAAMQLRSRDFYPDVICAHPGWGEALFLKDIWSDAKMLSFCEFYYRAKGSDVGFDPEFSSSEREEELCQLRMKNTHNLISLDAADRGVAPTRWQRDQYPQEFHSKIDVIFDGINTDLARPEKTASVGLKRDNLTLAAESEVITFVARNLEPYRGFHIFMRALPEILRRRPAARAVIIGGDEVSYGRKPPPGRTYRQIMLGEVGKDLDMNRVHFVGKVPYQVFLDVLRISSAHVYLTYPFVLSWSMIEAMSTECLVVGSNTGPVTEIVRDGENGVLVDFFDVPGLAETVIKVLENPESYTGIRKAARQTIVQNYDLKTVCLPAQVELVRSMV